MVIRTSRQASIRFGAFLLRAISNALKNHPHLNLSHITWKDEFPVKTIIVKTSDYDWAHLAYSLYSERVGQKCGTDKSLATAHDREDLYIEPPPTPGKKKKAKAVEAENNEMFESN